MMEVIVDFELVLLDMKAFQLVGFIKLEVMMDDKRELMESAIKVEHLLLIVKPSLHQKHFTCEE